MNKYETILKNNDENKKIGIYLTGAGGKAPFHIGFIKALEELEIIPDVIFGSSAGAIIGAGATYLNSQELYEKWSLINYENLFNIKNEKFASLNNIYGKKKKFLLYYKVILSCIEQGMLDIDNARILINNLLNSKKIMQSKTDFGLTTTLIPNFKILNIWKNNMTEDNILEYIVASMYLPLFRPTKIINNKFYSDTCNIKSNPFEILNEVNCTDILICDTSGLPISKDSKEHKKEFTKNVLIIEMKNKTSILDFSEEARKTNYEDGYNETMRVLTKKYKKEC